MAKKIKDIEVHPEKSRINLRGKEKEKNQRGDFEVLRKKYDLYKKESSITTVQDIKGKKPSYIYVKGKKFTIPKHLDNLIKIALIGFVIIFIINIINVYVTGKKIEEGVTQNAKEGFNFLVSAGKNTSKIEFDSALKSFDGAQNIFKQSQDELWFIDRDKTFYSKSNSNAYAVTSLLEAGQYFSKAGKNFLQAVEHFNKIPLYFVSKNSSEGQNNPSITDVLKKGLEQTDLAINEITKAKEKINEVNSKSLPTNIKSKVNYAKEKINEVSNILTSTSTHFPALLKLLGDRYPHRYLILLQNNNEIRPTGGFIGSYAIMDLNEGYIEKLDTHDVYDIDGSYRGVIEPPEEFKAFTQNWRFRDSNYSPDFKVSAQKARWFLDKEGGPSVDTVIALNQGILKDMMEITGPVQVGKFGELTSENYNLLLSYVIEGKVWGEEDPKHILKMFIPAFKEALLKEENLSRVMSKIYRAIQQKHIMMYSAHDDVQNFIEAVGLSGQTAEIGEKDDYLSVVHISTGGTKSEQFIQERINHSTQIDKNGGITNTVKISRTHLWTDSMYNKWKKNIGEYGFSKMPDALIDILGRGRNRVSTRVYVPNGSILIDEENKEIQTKYDKDLKKTYFFTTIDTKAGETKEVTIMYKLPFSLSLNPAATYKFIAEKQPGSRGSIFTKTFQTENSIKNIDHYPKDIKVDSESVLHYDTNLVYDRYFSTLITR